MDIKIKHGRKVYNKWHWVRRVPTALHHKYGKRIGRSTGQSDPYAAERQIQAWDIELEQSSSNTTPASSYTLELKKISAIEPDERGNRVDIEGAVWAAYDEIGEWNTEEKNKVLFDKIPPDIRMASAALSELGGNPRDPRFAFKLKDALIKYKKAWAADKNDRYLKMYDNSVTVYTGNAENKPLADIRRSDVVKWVQTLKLQSASKSTRGAHLSRLSQIYEHAQDREDIPEDKKNPFRDHRLGKDDEKPRRPMTDQELLTILNATPEPIDRLPAIIARHTGMRHAETFHSSLIEVKGVACFNITTTADGKFKPKTKSSERLVPVPDVILDLVRRTHHQLKQTNQKTHNNRFSAIKRKCFPEDRDLVFHSLRHTFITNAMRAEVNQSALAEVVGHNAMLPKTQTLSYHHGFNIEQKKALIEQVPPFDMTGIVLPYR